MSRAYDFDGLLRATTEEVVELPGGKKRTFYIRGLSIVEKEKRHKLAVLSAREMRRKLRNPESEEYRLEIEPLNEETDREVFVESLVAAKMDDLVSEAMNFIVRKDYPEASDEPDLDEMMDLEDEDEAIDKTLADERKTFVEERLADYRTSLEGLPVDELREMYRPIRIERLCYQSYMAESVNMTLYFGVYTDSKHKKRLLENYTEASELGDLYIRLRDAYHQLDQWSSEVLKN